MFSHFVAPAFGSTFLQPFLQTMAAAYPEDASPPPDTTGLTWADLPTVIWHHIFPYLGLTDRIRCERVCRQWREGILLAWSQVISLCTLLVPVDKWQEHRVAPFLAVMNRAGKGVVDLQVRAVTQLEDVHRVVQKAQAKGMPLTHISFVAVPLSPGLFELVAQWTSLKSLTLIRPFMLTYWMSLAHPFVHLIQQLTSLEQLYLESTY